MTTQPPQGETARPGDPATLLTDPNFKLGFISSMGRARAFLPEEISGARWPAIKYERGYHFATYCRTRGLRLSKLPRTPTDQLKTLIRQAAREGALI